MKTKTNATNKRNIFLPFMLIVMGCGVFLFAAWSAMTSPVLASIMNTPQAQQESGRLQPFGVANIAKPNPMAGESNAPLALIDPTPTATQLAQAEIPPTAESSTSSSDSGVYAQIVADTPTPEYVEAEPTVAPYMPVTGSGEHWIDVDLSQQRVYAYEGDAIVNSFIVSTGTWQTPTVTGEYKVWVKLKSAAMSGPGYYLPNVPYVMYFFGSYGLHGTYWHNNFGTPMSHGCVNLSIPDAEWLYNFSSVGTVVNVHY